MLEISLSSLGKLKSWCVWWTRKVTTSEVLGGGITFLFIRSTLPCYCYLEFICSGLFVSIHVWKNQYFIFPPVLCFEFISFLLFFCSPPSGEWKVFSGNELGALLGWWIFTCWKNHNRDTCAIKDVYMLSSTVSSKILRAIALKEGFHFEVSNMLHIILHSFICFLRQYHISVKRCFYF